MADLEKQLADMLKNPEIMQQVASMAQAFGMSPPTGGPPHTEEKQASAPPNPDMLQKLSRFATMPMLDKNQKNLLNALSPYLSGEKVKRLENAMTVAHLATLASTLFPETRSEVN